MDLQMLQYQLKLILVSPRNKKGGAEEHPGTYKLAHPTY